MNIFDYFHADFRVVPLHPIRNGDCSCEREDCEAIGKHPLVSNWQLAIPYSEEQIETFEQYQSDTGFGVICDGWLVVDIDPRNGGSEGYEKLCDDTGLDLKAESGFVVATGGGGWHIYFKAPEGVELVKHIKAYPGIDFKSNGFVVAAGSFHKSGSEYEAEKGHPDDIGETPAALVEKLKKEHYQRDFKIDGHAVDAQRIADMLEHISPDCDYEDWVKVGMAIHDETSGDGFSLWDTWSKNGSKYNADEMDYKWHSFGKSQNPVTIGTLIKLAEDGGYSEPVTFEVDDSIELKPETSINDKIKQVDTMTAPGLVGECIRFINQCSRFPRKSLAVSTGLQVVSCAGGMNVNDDMGATANLFTFNVADSSTGKEAIQSAQKMLLSSAGVIAAASGTIKSDRELYQNLTRHQASIYIIDELGIKLNQITNAGRNGAAYHEGTIGSLMSIYSKADDVLQLGGDHMEELKARVGKQIAALEKSVAENEATEFKRRQLDEAKAQMASLQDNNGIVNPFLSVSGYTTPMTFNNLINYEQATSGFIGRALIFEEKENNPRIIKGHRKPKEVPHEIAFSLKKLYTNGEAETMGGLSVCQKGQTIDVETVPECEGLLDEIYESFHEWAENEKETSGLQPLVRRGFEQVLKVSLILAMGDGMKRKPEHVLWAYKLVKDDLENKIMLTSASMAKEERRGSDALLNTIRHAFSKTEWKSAREVQRAKRTKADDTKKAVEHLVKIGFLEQKTIKPEGRGRPTTKYKIKC